VLLAGLCLFGVLTVSLRAQAQQPPDDALFLGGVFGRTTLHAAAPLRAAAGTPRVAAVTLAAATGRWPSHPLTTARADARPPRVGVLDPLGSASSRSRRPDGAGSSAAQERVRIGWDPDGLLAPSAPAPVEPASRDGESEPGDAPVLRSALVRCLEPSIHRRRAAARPSLLLDADVRTHRTWRGREEFDASRSRVTRGLYQVRLFDIRIAGQDIAFQWRAGSSSEGVRPYSGSPVSTNVTGGTEVIELSFGDPGGASFSSYVRGRRQPEDDYASAFGRGIEGTAGVQYSPGGRWDWRLQAQQQFVNHVSDPIEAMKFSLWARFRF